MLKSEVALLANFKRGHTERYKSCAEFILRNGRQWNWKPYPKENRAMRMGYCFANAARLAMRFDDILIYCEGYALGGIPMLHAWTVNKEGIVVDPTWHGRGKQMWTTDDYFGVAIKTEYIAQSAMRTKWHRSIIDNWYERWPILKDDPELWRHAINDIKP